MDIEVFKAQHGARFSVLPTNRFKVFIPLPAILLGKRPRNLATASSVEYWCESVQIPGYQILSHNVRRHTYGTNETRPFAPNFQPIELTFAFDGEADMWDLFNQWTQLILPHDTRDGDISKVSDYGLPGQLVYELSYKDEYKTDMEIAVYDKKNFKVATYKLRDAFPSNLNAVPLSWNEQDNYSRFTVFIEYLDWSV